MQALCALSPASPKLSPPSIPIFKRLSQIRRPTACQQGRPGMLCHNRAIADMPPLAQGAAKHLCSRPTPHAPPRRHGLAGVAAAVRPKISFGHKEALTSSHTPEVPNYALCCRQAPLPPAAAAPHTSPSLALFARPQPFQSRRCCHQAHNPLNLTSQPRSPVRTCCKPTHTWKAKHHSQPPLSTPTSSGLAGQPADKTHPSHPSLALSITLQQPHTAGQPSTGAQPMALHFHSLQTLQGSERCSQTHMGQRTSPFTPPLPPRPSSLTKRLCGWHTAPISAGSSQLLVQQTSWRHESKNPPKCPVRGALKM